MKRELEDNITPEPIVEEEEEEEIKDGYEDILENIVRLKELIILIENVDSEVNYSVIKDQYLQERLSTLIGLVGLQSASDILKLIDIYQHNDLKTIIKKYVNDLYEKNLNDEFFFSKSVIDIRYAVQPLFDLKLLGVNDEKEYEKVLDTVIENLYQRYIYPQMGYSLFQVDFLDQVIKLKEDLQSTKSEKNLAIIEEIESKPFLLGALWRDAEVRKLFRSISETTNLKFKLLTASFIIDDIEETIKNISSKKKNEKKRMILTLLLRVIYQMSVKILKNSRAKWNSLLL